MVVKVTSYKAHDGKLFDTEEMAAAHEAKLEQDTYISNLLYAITATTDMIDINRAKANIRTMFGNKNQRRIIRLMLDLFAEPGND